MQWLLHWQSVVCVIECHHDSGTWQVGLLYDIMTNSPGIQNICEVGFNSGHSALAFLEGVPNSRVVSFDLGAHQYVTVAFEVCGCVQVHQSACFEYY